MWKIWSDLGRMQWRDVHIIHSQNRKIKGLLLFTQEPKGSQVKVSHIGIIKKREVCLVMTTVVFMEKIRNLREDNNTIITLGEDHTFFLGYIKKPNF